MATPIVELIAVDIETAINAITVANGFEQTLVARRPKRLDDMPVNDLECFIDQGAASVVDREANSVIWEQEFILTAWLIDSDTATGAIDIRCNKAAADIIKKLLTDHQRTTLAIDTRCESVAMVTIEGTAWSGVAVGIVVQYRVSDTDPYTKV